MHSLRFLTICRSCFRGRKRNVRLCIICLTLVTLTWYLLLADFAYNRSNSLEADEMRRIPYEGRYVADPLCVNRGEQHNFVYIKMIKCASSTLSRVFRRFGVQRNLSFVLPPKNRIYIGWPYKIDETLYRPKKDKIFNILCEHTVYDEKKMAELMPADTVYVVSLRQPFSQVKSMLNYYNVFNLSGLTPAANQSSSDILRTYLTNIEKFEAVYKSPIAAPRRYCIPDGFSMSRNLMAYNLGFPTGFVNGTRDMADDDAFVRRWLDGVSSKFKLVLLTERFHESMVLLRRAMCWSLTDILFRSINSLTYGYKSNSDSQLEDIYRRWSRVDYALYERFNDSFNNALARQAADFWKEVTNYRTMNEMVNEFCSDLRNQTRGWNDVLVLEETPWSRRFLVDNVFCGLLLDEDNLPDLQDMYERKPPDVNEAAPSIKTC